MMLSTRNQLISPAMIIGDNTNCVCFTLDVNLVNRILFINVLHGVQNCLDYKLPVHLSIY